MLGAAGVDSFSYGLSICILNQPGDIFGDCRIILQQEPVMPRKQQIRRSHLFTQLIICFHPSNQINDQTAGPILRIVTKNMRAVGAENGPAPDGIHSNSLQRDRVPRRQKALDAG